MIISEQKSLVHFSAIVAVVICFIIALIYQNIEYMRIKMLHVATLNEYRSVMEEYDREKYYVQRAVAMEKIDAFANANGLVRVSQDSLIIIDNSKRKEHAHVQ